MDNTDVLYEISINLDIEDINSFVLINKKTYSLSDRIYRSKFIKHNNFIQDKNNKLQLVLRGYNRFMKVFKSEFNKFEFDFSISEIIAGLNIIDGLILLFLSLDIIAIFPKIIIKYGFMAKVNLRYQNSNRLKDDIFGPSTKITVSGGIKYYYSDNFDESQLLNQLGKIYQNFIPLIDENCGILGILPDEYFLDQFNLTN